MKIRLTPAYISTFITLLVLCGGLHEFTHHLAVRLICGEWGAQTFGSFSFPASCEGSRLRLLATLAGPAFTFLLLWIGKSKLQRVSADLKLFGFTLIFANVPINRMLVALLGHNDEQWAARQIFGQSRIAYAMVVLMIFAVCLPPLLQAWRALAGNEYRGQWFWGFYILPFGIKALIGTFSENYLLGKWQFMAETTVGVPHIVILVDAACLLIAAASWALTVRRREPSSQALDRDVLEA